MTENGRVHPNCVNASNPYHECGVACLEKIQQGKGRKDKKKSDFHIGIKEGVLGKKVDGGRRTHPSCPKASNPYHNCDEYCSYKTPGANPRGVKKESGSFLEATLSFGRKKKASEPEPPKSPQMVPTVPSSPFAARKKVESENGHSSSSSQQHSDGSSSKENSFEKGEIQPSESVPQSGHLTPDHPSTPPNGSFTCFAVATPTEQKDKEKPPVSPRASSFPFTNDVGKVTNDPVVRAMNFNLSSVSRATDESDEEETRSVFSESCVSVGHYHVRRNVASTLQLIFEKYGDIAASSRLESTSMRAHYLECLCTVVQELQSTTFKQLTKSKLKEMLAVLKDVESAQIDVSWLRGILSEIAEAMELNNQHQTAELALAECDDAIESTRKEIESLMEDLAQKEKAVADAKAQVAEVKTRLQNLELESKELNDSISSIWPKVEKFHSKPLADELL